jgi:multicomponent Na+:H+ antiporter subunit F
MSPTTALPPHVVLAPGYTIFLGGSIVIAALTFVSLYRAIVGPRAVDRLVAVNVINTKTVLLLALVAHVSTQYSFVDVALAYALTSFVTTVVVLKALLRGGL